MYRFIYEQRKVLSHRFLSIFLVPLMLLLGTMGGQVVGVASAHAAPLTPEATQYQAPSKPASTKMSEPNPSRLEEPDSGLVQSLEETAENVKEKLNLDEPLPRSTKLFFKQLKGEDVEVKEQHPYLK